MADDVKTVQILRQEWQLCPYEWGLEDYVVIDTHTAGKLILVSVEEWRSGDDGGVNYIPVLKDSLETFSKGDNA